MHTIPVAPTAPIPPAQGQEPPPEGASPPMAQAQRAPHRRLRPQGLAAMDVPGVWRADTNAAPTETWPSGHPPLDAQLPGGGWPAGGLVELLSAQPGLHEGAILAPHWASLLKAHPSGRLAWVMLGHSPWRVHTPGLARLGVPPERLWCVKPATEADAAWAVEQMLKSTGILGIWWITQHARSQHLRRLQWAAQSRGIPLFASRPLSCRQDPSPAPLRLHLQAGPDQSVQVRILKRQGPRHEQALILSSTAPLRLLPGRSLSAPTTENQAPTHVVDCPVLAAVAA